MIARSCPAGEPSAGFRRWFQGLVYFQYGLRVPGFPTAAFFVKQLRLLARSHLPMALFWMSRRSAV